MILHPLKSRYFESSFAGAFLVSPWFGKDRKPLIQRLFDPILALSEKGWKNLNFAWAAMFVVMSGLHVFFAFYSTAENIGVNLLHLVT